MKTDTTSDAGSEGLPEVDLASSETTASPPKAEKPAAKPKPKAKKPDAKKPAAKPTAAAAAATAKPTAKPEQVSTDDVVGDPGPDFKELTSVEELVEVYNEMVLTAIDLNIPKVTTVKMFVDVKTGVLACERLHDKIKQTREPKPSKKEKTTMAKTAKKTAAPKKVAASRGAAVKGKTTAKAPAAKKAAPAGGVKRADLDEAQKIAWVGQGKEAANPFRDGSGKHDRVEVLRKANGQTVKTYLAKGGNTGTLRTCVKLGLAKLAKAG